MQFSNRIAESMMGMSDEQAAQTILLVAGPGNTVVERIALALRQMGEQVFVAMEPQQVRDEAAHTRACLIVLAGGSTDDLATSAALRQSFPLLIPVVEMGQNPPSGNWTAPPIAYGGFIGPLVAQIQAAIGDPRASQMEIAQRMQGINIPPVSLPEVKTPKEIKQAKRRASAQRWRVVAIILQSVVLLMYIIGFFVTRQDTNSYASYVNHQFSLSTKPYDADVPGDGCDNQGALWSGTDPDTAICQSNGVLMTQKDINYFDEMNFTFDYALNRARFFPNAYQIGVEVSIQDTNGNTCAGLSFHTLPSGLGGQVVFVCPDGFWEFIRLAKDGKFDGDLVVALSLMRGLLSPISRCWWMS
jgi:hypothetical protein